MKKRAIYGVVLLLLLQVAPALSHDYWFVAESYFPPTGASVSLRLYLGDEFKIEEERPLQKSQTIRFQMLSVGKTLDLLAAGNEGQTPVARLKVGPAGNYLIAMDRRNQTIKLAAKKFTSYLREEGLDSVITRRGQIGESGTEGRERYSRYLKLLLQVGDRHDDTYKRALGQRLEMIPQSSPYEIKIGERLRVLVLFEGKPLSGAKVFAYSRDGATVGEQAVRTSGEGLAEFTIDKAGEWLVRLVHMRRCEGCGDADWESFWGAFSFGMK